MGSIFISSGKKWVEKEGTTRPTPEADLPKMGLITQGARQKPLEKRSMGDYFERKLDSKRRLIIPTELREELASGVVITRGFKQYLHLYPKSVWDEQVETQLSGNILDEATADLNVQFRTGKTEAAIDGKGRVTLEQHLLDYAGIAKEVQAVRAGRYWRLSAKQG